MPQKGPFLRRRRAFKDVYKRQIDERGSEGKANDVKKETGMKRMIMALIFLSLLVSTFVAGCGIDQRKRDGRTGASPVKVVPLPYEEGPFPAF